MMRRILWLARREYLTSVRTKSFILALVIAPVMMSGSGIAFALLKDRVDTTDKKVAVVDRSGIVAEGLVEAAEQRNSSSVYDEETGEKIRPAYIMEIVEPNQLDPDAQRLELSNRIRWGELHAFVDIGPEVLHPGENTEAHSIAYHARNAAIDDLRGWLGWPINSQLRKARLIESGADESAIDEALSWISVNAMGLVSVDEKTGAVQGARQSSKAEAFLGPVIMMMLMFLMVMMSAVPLLNAVMEEKSQRIAEVILGSAKPFEFMAGKLIGGIGVSLTGSIVYVVGGIIAVKYMGWDEYIPYHVLPWFFTFMVSTIIMMGSVFIALGAACNNVKDAQSLTFPAMLPVIIPMFIMMPVAKEPLSGFSTWMSLIPPFTPTLMLLRLTSPMDIPSWQPWVGLAGLLIITVIAVWAGGRVFRVAILMQGTPPKVGNILRWTLRG
jgi:ABC-type Na+ efflux pump permease subunit